MMDLQGFKFGTIFQLCLTLEGGTEPSVINMEGKLFP